jgi:hypothetical protein
MEGESKLDLKHSLSLLVKYVLLYSQWKLVYSNWLLIKNRNQGVHKTESGRTLHWILRKWELSALGCPLILRVLI